MPRKTKISTAAKSTKGAQAAKPKKSVTQSTRFGPEQMREIEKACSSKGWSVAKLMQIATLEKALAVNQVQERRSDVAQTARKLAWILFGAFPRVAVNNRALGCPGDDEAEWKPAEYCDEGDMFVDFDDDSPIKSAFYDHSTKTLRLQTYGEPNHWGECDAKSFAEIEIDAPSPAMVERVLETISAVGPEIVRLVADEYRDLQNRNASGDKEYAKFKTVDDLLDEKERKK